MPEYPAEKRLEVYSLYFQGYAYDGIVEEMQRRGRTLSKGTVASWLNALKQGHILQFANIREEVETLREAAVLLRKHRLTASEAVVGLAFWKRLQQLGVEPQNLDVYIKMCREISPKDFPVREFVDTTVRLHMLEVKLGKPYEDALNDMEKAFKETSLRLDKLNSQVEVSEKKKTSLENDLKELESKHGSSTARLKELTKGVESLENLGVEKVSRLSAFVGECEKLGYSAQRLEELVKLVDEKSTLKKQVSKLHGKIESLTLEVKRVERRMLTVVAKERSLSVASNILNSHMVNTACGYCQRPVSVWIPPALMLDEAARRGLTYQVKCFSCGNTSQIPIWQILASVGWAILQSELTA